MPTVKLPDLHAPNVDLSKVELPKVDWPNLELPRVDLSGIDVPHAIGDRLPGARRTNPLPIVFVGLAVAGFMAWLVTLSPLAPRIRAAATDVRAWMTAGHEDGVLDDTDADVFDTDLGSFTVGGDRDDAMPDPAFEPAGVSKAADQPF
jgi:hypothetical protein